GEHHGRVVGHPPGGPVRVAGAWRRPPGRGVARGGRTRRGGRRRRAEPVGHGPGTARRALTGAGGSRGPAGCSGHQEDGRGSDRRPARAAARGGRSRGFPGRLRPVRAAVNDDSRCDPAVPATYHAAMTTPRGGDTVRFLHTADWQLGMTRRFLGDDSKAVFTAARLASVAALAELATEHGAQFIVVAGDAFEDNAVPRSVVLRAAEVLAGFSVPVL